MFTAETMSTSRHLSELAFGRLSSSPFSGKTVDDLRDELVRVLSDSGHAVIRGPGPKRDADRLPAAPQPSIRSS